MAKNIVFIDAEISVESKKICDLGAIRDDRIAFHSGSVSKFYSFIANAEFICGHNIIHHDMKYIQTAIEKELKQKRIDTLYLSPLLFPKRPYHSLLKDDKLQVEELNNPVNDCKKARELFYDEVNAFSILSWKMKQILYRLLHSYEEFSGFFDYINFKMYPSNVVWLIRKEFSGKLCENADLNFLILHFPRELAYALSLIRVNDSYSITPPWLLHQFPNIENVIKILRNTPCTSGCKYCRETLNIHTELKRIFGYDKFRVYNGEPLQEKAARAAVEGKSLLAVFPTGGGKSITFQLPALMAGRAIHGLTVVISPLQSLMKDQVDNLNRIGITEAVTINGLLDPIERANAIERVKNGSATMLYISPEQLRSRTIESLLCSRNIARFVIDEAHCFSAWGQDFRVDYLYIGDFICELQKKKLDKKPIPVSCFTATAKQKVISDICDYFKKKLDVTLELYASSATRENLHYKVLYKETDEEKYNTLRSLIAQKNCPTIVYVSRTKRTEELAEKLTKDGFLAKPFHGKMDANDKIVNQEEFIQNKVSIIVATSAFGMGVDKKDVKLVIHYEISDSLENYVQEAGRAGRDPSMQAECYVLYNDKDLDKHFVLLNQTKLSISEIQQVWKAIKDLTRFRPRVCCSPLEIARQAGWDDSVKEIETRVKTAIAALEDAGYVERGRNVPHVYATSILAKNMEEASKRIDNSTLFSEEQRKKAKRIVKSLISRRSIAIAGNDDAESRVDYLADTLGITKEEVIGSINLMRQEGLLADSQDMSAYILSNDTQNKSLLLLERFAKLESFLLTQLTEEGFSLNLKEINEAAQAKEISFSSVKNLRILLYYLTIKNYVRKAEDGTNWLPVMEVPKLVEKQSNRIELCKFILQSLYSKVSKNINAEQKEQTPVQFSLVGLFQEFKETPRLQINQVEQISLKDVEDALLYLSKIGALKIEGGFLVLYNGIEVKRLIADNRIKYKIEDYRFLDEFYKQKIRQIHIVGEYANLMVRDYNAALQFVQDYFQMDFRKFMTKYFKGERAKDIDRNITPEKYHQLFGELSEKQLEIVNDAQSKYIVVAAGPGSGKTRVLVHKLASLLLLEDVKHEQLLMLTFSRAAAMEFKKRLIGLIENTAYYVEIKTFHSYCFDLIGKMGNLDGSENVVEQAVTMIQNGEVEQGKITKRVLVIDEAQDMSESDFRLVCALMQYNEDMRVIAVGDDDQNIYEFRGSDSKYLRSLIQEYGATKYEMTENYRSKQRIVEVGNRLASTITTRMKSSMIKSVQEEKGNVTITHHVGKQMIEAVVKEVKNTYQTGTACVLTNTNEEALQILGLLHKEGIRAKMIQSLGDELKVYDIVEIRSFIKKIKKECNSPLISEELWESAKQKLFTTYADSTSLDICRNVIQSFEELYPAKYRTDLEEFLKESNYEDFYEEEKGTIFVSTIHKSKGREFDTVYMMLNGNSLGTEAEKRKLYVGMTRAKEALYIHCNTRLFQNLELPNVVHVVDNKIYDEPKELSVQLTHKDVVLDFFKENERWISIFYSGISLCVGRTSLYVRTLEGNKTVAIFSKAFCERLVQLRKKGYVPYSACVRFIVAWRGKGEERETAVLLPDICFRRI